MTLLKWEKNNQDDNDRPGIVSETFRHELKIDYVWQRANEEERGLADSAKQSHLLPQQRLHGNELSCREETEWLIKSCKKGASLPPPPPPSLCFCVLTSNTKESPDTLFPR